MSEYGELIETASVRFERLLPGPIERVWAYLTESEKRGTWLATGEMELRAGGKVELNFKHADLSPVREEVPADFKKYEEGVTSCGHVIRCEPPRLLVITWNEKQQITSHTQNSEVTFELETQGDQVLLTLTHRRLPNRAEMLSVSGGWHTHLGVLVDQLNGRTPAPFWSTHAKYSKEYERRIPG